MANPVFDNSALFGDQRRVGRGGTLAQGAAGAQTADAVTLEQMYATPDATTRETGRLTYDDVIIRTVGLLALLVVAGAATWVLAPELFWAGAIVGLVLGLVNAFKKKPSPVLITLYALAQGVFLGGISAFYEAKWNGIVGQAVLATLCVFVVSLVAFRSGKVRVTPKFTRGLMIGMVGYLLFSLINVGMMLFGVNGGDFGPLRSGPWGILVGLFAVGLAAASLVVDFDSIKRGVDRGVPRSFAWYASFGLLVTLIWLYLELLRIIAIFRN